MYYNYIPEFAPRHKVLFVPVWDRLKYLSNKSPLHFTSDMNTHIADPEKRAALRIILSAARIAEQAINGFEQEKKKRPKQERTNPHGFSEKHFAILRPNNPAEVIASFIALNKMKLEVANLIIVRLPDEKIGVVPVNRRKEGWARQLIKDARHARDQLAAAA